MSKVHTGPTPDALVRCQIHVPDANAQTAVQPVFVNGSEFPIQINEPILVPAAVYDALAASTLKVDRLPDGEDAPPAEGADAGAAEGPGGSDGGAEPVKQPAQDPLDHDGDGKKGGSKKGAASTRAKGAAKSTPKKAKAKAAAKSKE